MDDTICMNILTEQNPMESWLFGAEERDGQSKGFGWNFMIKGVSVAFSNMENALLLSGGKRGAKINKKKDKIWKRNKHTIY